MFETQSTILQYLPNNKIYTDFRVWNTMYNESDELQEKIDGIDLYSLHMEHVTQDQVII